MKIKSLLCLPEKAFVSFGGYTWVKPDAWRRYLDSTLRIRYPMYYIKNVRQKNDSSWLENDCIFASLSKYLFSQFGMLVPEDSLFKVYNPKGEGILPGKIIDAIMAVIEPLGFEIDRVLVADDELRAAMSHPDLVVGLSNSSEFAGKAGLCMINVKEGYSHAFFWKQMDPEKFSDEQFRMAVLVRRNRKDQTASLSALQCFDDFCSCLSACLPKNQRGKLLQAEIRCLSKYIHDPLNRLGEQFRTRVGQQLASILALSKSASSNSSKKLSEDLRFLDESCLIVDRIFRECEEFCN